MTIAIGLLASDGLVFAADTQETIPGYWKNEQGKVNVCARSGLPADSGVSMGFFSGAGNSEYVSTLSLRLLKRFMAEPYISTSDDVVAALSPVLEEFHSKHILPFGSYPSAERPTVKMIGGWLYTKGTAKLFVTEENLLHEQSFYAAVGVGSALANTLLQRFYQLDVLDVWDTMLLAAYVMNLVKESVDGCGKHTDIGFLAHESPRQVRLTRVESDALERVFEEYSNTVEARHFRDLCGAPMPRRPGSVSASRRRLKQLVRQFQERRKVKAKEK